MKNEPQVTIHDFEAKAKELSKIMYALTEQRFHVAVKLNSPVGRAMQESVLSVRAAVDTFLYIARLSDLP